jgi:hypothetical protein
VLILASIYEYGIRLGYNIGGFLSRPARPVADSARNAEKSAEASGAQDGN